MTNVTGDLDKYGIVTDAPKSTSQSTMYKVDIGGSEITVSNSKSFSVVKWQPCRVIYSGNSVDTLTPLVKLTTVVKNINEVSCTSGNMEYLISDKVSVYERNMNQSYRMIPLKDLIESQENYTVYAYYDKSVSSGGRIRVLLATPK